MLRMVEEEARRQSRFLNDVVEQLDQLALSTSRLVVTSEKKRYTSSLVKGKVLITTLAGLSVTVFKSL